MLEIFKQKKSIKNNEIESTLQQAQCDILFKKYNIKKAANWLLFYTIISLRFLPFVW